MKSVLMMDVDGVVRNFHGGCVDLINQQLGTSYRAEDVRAWNIFKSLGVPAEIVTATYDAMRAPGWCSSLQPYPDALDGVRALQKHYEVVPCTAPMRGTNRGPCAPYWPHETEAWLKKYFGFDHDDVIHTSAKHWCGGRHLIDDKISNLEIWERYNPRGSGIHFNRYGEHFGGAQVHTWKELVEYLCP